MAIVVVFEFPNDDVAKYERVFEIVGAPILEQPNRRFHTCYLSDTGFTVVDVREDEASFAAFGEVLGPVLAEVGLDAAPQIHQLQSTTTQGGVRQN